MKAGILRCKLTSQLHYVRLAMIYMRPFNIKGLSMFVGVTIATNFQALTCNNQLDALR
jgi:hypothetical protein